VKPGLAPPVTDLTRQRESSVKAHAARQRERILDAAELRFIESGFHAASMAHIAGTAGMSAGLIYRYFDNKSAIVKAIIQRHLESEHIQGIGKIKCAADASREMLVMFEAWRCGNDPKINPVLMLELAAECTRDPEIARAVRRKDHALGAALAQTLRRIASARGSKLTAAAARSRAVMLQCLVEGLAFRVVRDPKLRSDTLKPALDSIIELLMG
jgi:AcrR family transcriptional regulator